MPQRSCEWCSCFTYHRPPMLTAKELRMLRMFTYYGRIILTAKKLLMLLMLLLILVIDGLRSIDPWRR